jgi:general secretion pathway protein L
MVRRFFDWWFAELAALLPGAVRERLQRSGRRLLVDYDGAKATYRLSGAPAPLEAITGEEIRKACGGPLSGIVVRLSPSQALRRTVTLPLAAEANLRAVLGFEMDRYTPFKAEEIYYDFVVLARDPEKRNLQVALVLVPRQGVDALFQSLRGGGLEPTSLELEGDPAALNLLPSAQRGTGQAGARWPTRALGALALLLLVTALALPLVQKMQAVSRLETEAAAVRKEALATAQARKALDQLAAEEDALINRRRERPAAIEVLHEVTRLLPDSAWLNQFELAAARLRIRGEAANASELLTAIENSTVLKGASLEGSVTRDAKTERERFAISASVASGAKR